MILEFASDANGHGISTVSPLSLQLSCLPAVHLPTWLALSIYPIMSRHGSILLFLCSPNFIAYVRIPPATA